MLPKVQKLAHIHSPWKIHSRIINHSLKKFNHFCTSYHYYMCPLPFRSGNFFICVNSPKLRKQVPFADWRKYVLLRQYLKNTVSVNSAVKRPGNASSIYREDEKKSWAKWYRISSGVFLSPGVDGSLRFYHKGMKRQEIIYWPAVMEKRHSHLFLVFCWRISSVDNLDWKQIGLFS